MTTSIQPSRFSRFSHNPITIEVGRFTAYTLVTLGGKWLFSKAGAAYRARKSARAAAQPSSQQPMDNQPAQQESFRS